MLIKGKFILLLNCRMWENVSDIVYLNEIVCIYSTRTVCELEWKVFSLAFFSIYCVSDVNTSLSSAVPLISSLLSSLLPFLIPLSFSLCVCLLVSLLSFISNTLVSLFPIFLFCVYIWNGILACCTVYHALYINHFVLFIFTCLQFKDNFFCHNVFYFA